MFSRFSEVCFLLHYEVYMCTGTFKFLQHTYIICKLDSQMSAGISCSLTQLSPAERHRTNSKGHQFITGLTHRDKQPLTLTFTPTGNYLGCLMSNVTRESNQFWQMFGICACYMTKNIKLMIRLVDS